MADKRHERHFPEGSSVVPFIVAASSAGKQDAARNLKLRKGEREKPALGEAKGVMHLEEHEDHEEVGGLSGFLTHTTPFCIFTRRYELCTVRVSSSPVPAGTVLVAFRT
jgi:hypothetical protein